MIADTLIALASLTLLTLIGYGLACRLMPADASRLRLLCAEPLGLAAVGLTLWFINAIFRLPINPVTAAATSAAWAYMSWRWWRPRSWSWPKLAFASPATMIVAAAVGLITLGLIVAALLGPLQGWDIFYYHLPTVDQIIQSSHLPGPAGISYQQMVLAYPPLPFLGYALPGLFVGHPVLPLFTLQPILLAIILLAVVYDFVRHVHRASPLAGWLAVAMLLSAVPFIQISRQENIDLFFTVFALLAMNALGRYLRQGGRAWLTAGSLMLAAGAWSKYHGLIVAIIIFGLFAIARLFRRPEFPTWRVLAAQAGLILLLVAPFFIRNWVVNGNPVYPGFVQQLGGREVDAWSLTNIVPYTAPQLFYHLDRTVLFSWLFPLLVLALAASIARRPWRDSLTTILVVFTWLYVLAWAAVMRAPHSESTRFLIPAVTTAAILVGVWLARLAAHRQGWWLAVGAVIALTIAARQPNLADPNLPRLYIATALALGFFTIAAIIRTAVASSVALLIGVIVLLAPSAVLAKTYLQASLQHWRDRQPYMTELPEARWMAEHIPPRASILSFEDRRWLFPRSIYPADAYDLRPLYESADLDFITAELKRRGIAYIYDSGQFWDHPLYRAGFFQSLGRIEYFTPVYAPIDSPIRIYRLADVP